MNNRYIKKVQKLFIYLCIFCWGVLPVHEGVANSAPVSDLDGHWAKNELTNWINHGYLEGYGDGSIKPDHLATRAEIIKLINRSFGFSGTTDVSKFTDIKPEDWFYEDVQKAVKAGYIERFEDGTFRPEYKTTRQHVAVMIARILDLNVEEHKHKINGFNDHDQISEWSAGAIGALAEQHIMKGYPSGEFLPEGFITRAKVVVTLERARALKEKMSKKQSYLMKQEYMVQKQELKYDTNLGEAEYILLFAMRS